MAKIISPRAELAVLRGMTSKNKKIAGILLSSVDDSYFATDESQEIYQAVLRHMQDSGESPSFKIMTLDPEISEEAREFFRESQVVVTTETEAHRAARTLDKYRKARGLYNLSAHLNAKLNSKSKLNLDELMEGAATALNIIRSKKSTQDSFVHFGKNNNSLKFVESILYDDVSDTVIPTGIKPYDDVSGGMPRGSLVTIGATSGGGKSLCANTLAKNMAQMGYKVVVVPLEMSKKEMTSRLMANVTRTNLTKIMLQRLAKGEKEQVLLKMKKWMKKVKVKGGRYTIFKPQEDMTIEEIFAALSAYSCDVVIVDYISLLKGVDGDDSWQRLGAVARYAKINAEVENRVNILLCQVSEEGKIRYARSISEHSSISWVWTATKEAKESGIMRIEQPKSRNSLSFPFTVRMLWEYMAMEAAPDDDSIGPADGVEDLGDERKSRRGDRDRDKPRDKKKKKLKNLADDESDV